MRRVSAGAVRLAPARHLIADFEKTLWLVRALQIEIAECPRAQAEAPVALNHFRVPVSFGCTTTTFQETVFKLLK